MIAFAQYNDIDEIMHFIDKEWRKGHILARDRAFFEYMYVPGKKEVNFVVSKNGSRIDGILGYIPYDKDRTQVALTVWKALKSANGMIGMSMLHFIEKVLEPRIIASTGIDPLTTTAIYRYFKHEVGKMDHFYRLAGQGNYKIASIRQGTIKDCPPSNASIRHIDSIEQYRDAGIGLTVNAIQKDEWYVNWRYFDHPIFKYQFFLVEQEGSGPLVVVAREQEAEQSKCLRIVDLLGNYDLIQGFTSKVDDILYENDCEYIDCYVAGIKKSMFTDCGWSDIEETEDIIPNYFAPFERENVDLYYSCKPGGIVMLRGDGDQDRPN